MIKWLVSMVCTTNNYRFYWFYSYKPLKTAAFWRYLQFMDDLSDKNISFTIKPQIPFHSNTWLYHRRNIKVWTHKERYIIVKPNLAKSQEGNLKLRTLSLVGKFKLFLRIPYKIRYFVCCVIRKNSGYSAVMNNPRKLVKKRSDNGRNSKFFRPFLNYRVVRVLVT